MVTTGTHSTRKIQNTPDLKTNVNMKSLVHLDTLSSVSGDLHLSHDPHTLTVDSHDTHGSLGGS